MDRQKSYIRLHVKVIYAATKRNQSNYIVMSFCWSYAPKILPWVMKWRKDFFFSIFFFEFLNKDLQWLSVELTHDMGIIRKLSTWSSKKKEWKVGKVGLKKPETQQSSFEKFLILVLFLFLFIRPFFSNLLFTNWCADYFLFESQNGIAAFL